MLDYDPSLQFKNQLIFWILKGLPLNILVTGKAPNEEITVKFVHDSIKNFFLV